MKMYTAQEMREMALVEESYGWDVVAKMLRQAADMMEQESTSEKSSQVGNAAAMREACANIAEYSKTAACHTEDAHLLGYLNQIEMWAEAALSAPPRNCDICTVE